MATVTKNSQLFVVPTLLIVLVLACNLPLGDIQEDKVGVVSALVGVWWGDRRTEWNATGSARWRCRAVH